MFERPLPAWLATPLVWLALVPAWIWARKQERLILAEGRPLGPGEMLDARAAGVASPGAIRLLVVPEVPTPGAPLLRTFARMCRIRLDPPAGMALGHGIYLDESAARSRFILVHECVHIAQYERAGGRLVFLRRYLDDCLRESYWASAMEEEANEIATRVCVRVS